MWVMVAGFFSGILGGMGIGGGTILIPALVFLCELSQNEAQFLNLLYFIPTGAVAFFIHMKKGNVRKEVLLPVILAGLFSAAAGAFAATILEEEVLRKFFGGFLLLMSIKEIFSKKK
ncbi:MAG: sulfite exporter TauE/SafE family protein [Clostridiales bacterium]|nr:sulfite exporter TauE/SafE family protein [Clostridiales bacterium]